MEKNIKISQILKYIVCIFLSLTIFFVGSVYASNLTDMDTHWSKEYAEYLTNKGAINGYPDETFRPDNTVTYAEAIKLIVASYNKNIQNGEKHWASNYVQYAKDTGIAPQNMFVDNNVDKPITRKEVIYMVYQSLIEYAKKPITNNERSEIDLPFKDVTISINKYGIDYIKPIKECYYLGIIIGNDLGLMNPDSKITRAEIATILTRAYAEEYRSYPMTEITSFYPTNSSQYRMILAYMPNSFYEAGNASWSRYINSGTPYKYLDYSVRDITYLPLNNIRQKTEKIMNALINVSYDMTENEWNAWKEKILLAEDITEQQVQEYIQYVKDNKIQIKGGAIMNPCTLGQFYISKNESSLGIKGMINYEIVSNSNNAKYLTIAEYITNTKGIIKVEEPKYVIMYLENTTAETTFELYNLKCKIAEIQYM